MGPREEPLHRSWFGHHPVFVKKKFILETVRSFKPLCKNFFLFPNPWEYSLNGNIFSYWMVHFYVMRSPPKYYTSRLPNFFNSPNRPLNRKCMHGSPRIFWVLVWRERGQISPSSHYGLDTLDFVESHLGIELQQIFKT